MEIVRGGNSPKIGFVKWEISGWKCCPVGVSGWELFSGSCPVGSCPDRSCPVGSCSGGSCPIAVMNTELNLHLQKIHVQISSCDLSKRTNLNTYFEKDSLRYIY